MNCKDWALLAVGCAALIALLDEARAHTDTDFIFIPVPAKCKEAPTLNCATGPVAIDVVVTQPSELFLTWDMVGGPHGSYVFTPSQCLYRFDTKDYHCQYEWTPDHAGWFIWRLEYYGNTINRGCVMEK